MLRPERGFLLAGATPVQVPKHRVAGPSRTRFCRDTAARSESDEWPEGPPACPERDVSFRLAVGMWIATVAFAQEPAPVFTAAGVVSAASFAPGITPGGLATVFAGPVSPSDSTAFYGPQAFRCPPTFRARCCT